MRAILINAKDQTVTEIDHSGQLADLYASIGCSLVECISIAPGVDLWVDEEGLINGTDYGFTFFRGLLPVRGNAVMLSVTDDGDCAALPDGITAEMIRQHVQWARAADTVKGAA